MGEGERQEAHKRVLGRIAGETMGGRGASSGLSVKGKPYGSEYHTVLKSGNIKFVKMNDSSRATTAPMETMTKNRVYVTISNDKNEPKFITYYDKENKRYKQIDLSGKSHSEGKRELRPPHTHLGYEHDENGTRALTLKERKLVDNVKKMWNTYING